MHERCHVQMQHKQQHTYINRMQSPTITHSMKIASPSGMKEVSSSCTQLVTMLKSNILICFI